MLCTTYFLTFFSELIPPTGNIVSTGLPNIYSFHHEVKIIPPRSKNRSTMVERFLLHGGTNTCSLSGS